MGGRQIRRSILIDATPEQVWEWLVDAQRELRWRSPQVVELERLDDGPLTVGSRFRGGAAVMGRRDTWINEMTAVDPPKQMSWRMVETTAPAWGPGSYQLAEEADGTRMTIEIDYQPRKPIGRILVPVFTTLVAPRVIDGFLEQLKNIVEAQHHSGTQSAQT
ncbi:MAG: SRPBCC family protein [Acidimicrobiales bacterium]